MVKSYLEISLKSLKHRGIRSWLTLLGVVIGVSLVVSLILIGDGLRLAVENQFGGVSKEIISVRAKGVDYGIPGSGSTKPLTEKELEEVKKIQGVKSVLRRNIEQGVLEYKDKKSFVFVTNVPLKEKKFFYEALDLKVISGRLLDEGDSKKIIVGYNFYKESDGEISPGKKLKINNENFEVVGVAKKKGSFIFDNIIFMPEEDMKRIFDYGEKINFIGVQADSKDKIGIVKERIEERLRKIRNVKEGQEDFIVTTPQAMLNQINEILKGIQIFIIIIASISIIVGIIGILNTMNTSVLERKKDIGIMKAIGAKNSQIFLQFFLESGLIGLIGGIVGIIFGISIGYISFFFLENFTGVETSIRIDYGLMMIILLSSFFIGSLGGVYPALKAAKQNPVEAIRG
ncbi:MAG: ABC transporter permease [Candidatus Pacearchaeota archaeon]